MAARFGIRIGVLAATQPCGQGWADVGKHPADPARSLLAVALAAGNLLHEIDNAAPQLGIGNAHEGLG